MGKGCPRRFDAQCDRRRNAVERCVESLEGCRFLTTRHEKLAIRFAAMIPLAFLGQDLWVLRPPERTWQSGLAPAGDREP
jgi:hypothetical protein